MKKYKIIFSDLDDTLIRTLSKETFPKGIWDMGFKFNVLNKIKELKPEYLLIVSNQGGIEKGDVSKENFEKKLDYICSAISEYCGVKVLAKYCPSRNRDNHYRKPNLGMLYAFNDELKFKNVTKTDDWKAVTLMIGDASGKFGQFSDSDKLTAEKFGIDYMDVEDFVKYE